jgi:hypothetical protein
MVYSLFARIVNPAASVRGPRHVVRSGKTPVLDPAEARRLLDSIDISTPAGLRWLGSKSFPCICLTFGWYLPFNDETINQIVPEVPG